MTPCAPTSRVSHFGVSITFCPSFGGLHVVGVRLCSLSPSCITRLSYYASVSRCSCPFAHRSYLVRSLSYITRGWLQDLPPELLAHLVNEGMAEDWRDLQFQASLTGGALSWTSYPGSSYGCLIYPRGAAMNILSILTRFLPCLWGQTTFAYMGGGGGLETISAHMGEGDRRPLLIYRGGGAVETTSAHVGGEPLLIWGGGGRRPLLIWGGGGGRDRRPLLHGGSSVSPALLHGGMYFSSLLSCPSLLWDRFSAAASGSV